jgi:hypothetical protein
VFSGRQAFPAPYCIKNQRIGFLALPLRLVQRASIIGIGALPFPGVRFEHYAT